MLPPLILRSRRRHHSCHRRRIHLGPLLLPLLLLLLQRSGGLAAAAALLGASPFAPPQRRLCQLLGAEQQLLAGAQGGDAHLLQVGVCEAGQQRKARPCRQAIRPSGGRRGSQDGARPMHASIWSALAAGSAAQRGAAAPAAPTCSPKVVSILG